MLYKYDTTSLYGKISDYEEELLLHKNVTASGKQQPVFNPARKITHDAYAGIAAFTHFASDRKGSGVNTDGLASK